MRGQRQVTKEPIEVVKCAVCGNYYEVGTGSKSEYIDIELCTGCKADELAFGHPSYQVLIAIENKKEDLR